MFTYKFYEQPQLVKYYSHCRKGRWRCDHWKEAFNALMESIVLTKGQISSQCSILFLNNTNSKLKTSDSQECFILGCQIKTLGLQVVHRYLRRFCLQQLYDVINIQFLQVMHISTSLLFKIKLMSSVRVGLPICHMIYHKYSLRCYDSEKLLLPIIGLIF